MGVMAPYGVGDGYSDAVRVAQNVGVPEAQDSEPLAPQEIRSADLSFRLVVVLAAIDLDNQLGIVTDEIGDVASNRHLTSESAAIQLPSTEHAPQFGLRGRHLASQRPGTPNGAVDRMPLHPP